MTDTIELKHKGFFRVVRYDAGAGLFHGEVVICRALRRFKPVLVDSIQAQLWSA
jgi:predicted HicB family RNase H-like nuclease